MTTQKIKTLDVGRASRPLIKIYPDDIQQGIYSSSASPVGNYRTSWIIQLKNKSEKCQIPRGFGRLSGKHI